ncbi:MAG: IS5 family transposase [Verrucomicrobiae bacterium]|nr:IS5 family transposase [Verrucomicrobiae bacterium]
MRYTTDLSDFEWQLLQNYFPKPASTGRPRKHSYRELLNAMFYLVRTSCQWRNLPKDFAPWGTVYHYFRKWKQSGLWERIHTRLRQQVRRAARRHAQPSAAIVDSQSVKSSECSDARGYDAGKKINGRKRHLLVDTLGLVLLVLVLPANIQDRDGARQLLDQHFGRRPRRRVKHLWADAGYAGTLVAWALAVWRCTVEIVKRTELHTFKGLPRRWVVERTFGWLNRYRRLSRDYERQAHTGETMVYLAMIRLMLARLAAKS